MEDRFHILQHIFGAVGYKQKALNAFTETCLAWDMIALLGLMPFKNDFINYIEVDLPMKDVATLTRLLRLL